MATENNFVKKRLKIFNEHYTMLFSSLDIKDKIHIGEKTNKVCRFCHKNEDETSFKNVAHAIPESIGNKKIILYEECDDCNKFFSENIEVHFDKLTKPLRNVGQVKGKRSVPSYKTKDKLSRIDVKDDFQIQERIDSRITTFDEENNQIILNYEVEPYIPQAIYKTFVKMALSVMPSDELKNFKEALQWIQEPDHTKTFMQPLKVLTTFIPGPNKHPEPVVFLLKRKTETNKYPYSIFVVAFGNMIYQIVVPSLYGIERDSETTTTIIKFPSPFEITNEHGKVKHGVEDWTSSEVVKGKKIPVHLSYESMEESPINKD